MQTDQRVQRLATVFLLSDVYSPGLLPRDKLAPPCVLNLINLWRIWAVVAVENPI